MYICVQRTLGCSGTTCITCINYIYEVVCVCMEFPLESTMYYYYYYDTFIKRE